MRIRTRALAIAVGLGLLAGLLPTNVGSAQAITLNTCTRVGRTVSVQWNFGPDLNTYWMYATLTFWTPVKTADYTNYYLCATPSYTGDPAALQSFTPFQWAVVRNSDGTINFAYGSASWSPDPYTITFVTQVRRYGDVTETVSVTTAAKASYRCYWGFGTSKQSPKPYTCQSQHAVTWHP